VNALYGLLLPRAVENPLRRVATSPNKLNPQIQRNADMKIQNIIMTAADHAQLDRVIAFAGEVSESCARRVEGASKRARTRAVRRGRGDPGGPNHPNQLCSPSNRMIKELSPKKLCKRIGRYVMIKTPIEVADLAFVFGTRDGVEEFADEIDRYWKRGFFPWIVIAGGSTQGNPNPESDVLREKLINRGVDANCVICERNSTNTGENVQLSLPLIKQHIDFDRVRSIIAVGKISSSRRYLMTLERYWPEPKKMILPINYFGVPENRWFEDPGFRSRVITEWNKIPYYLTMGFLKEINPRSLAY
jgi:hypothetical protein